LSREPLRCRSAELFVLRGAAGPAEGVEREQPPGMRVVETASSVPAFRHELTACEQMWVRRRPSIQRANPATEPRGSDSASEGHCKVVHSHFECRRQLPFEMTKH
jgi:hypothetical protein